MEFDFNCNFNFKGTATDQEYIALLKATPEILRAFAEVAPHIIRAFPPEVQQQVAVSMAETFARMSVASAQAVLAKTPWAMFSQKTP